MIGSLSSSGLSGIQQGLGQVRTAAANIARRSLPPTAERGQDGLPEALVGLRQGQIQVAASVKAIQAADQALGSLLDLRA